MNKITLCISSGRCGTTFLANSFQESLSEDQVAIYHESLHPDIAKPAVFHRSFDDALLNKMYNQPGIKAKIKEWEKKLELIPIVDFGWTMYAAVPLFYKIFQEQFRVLVISRHPFSVAASFANKGSYTLNKSSNWAITPNHDRVFFPSTRVPWTRLGAFEKGLYRWLEIYKYADECQEKLPADIFLNLKGEDIFQDAQTAINEIQHHCGLENYQIIPSNRKNENNQADLESRPLVFNVNNYKNIEGLVSFAKQKGFSMEEDDLRLILNKYSLPKSLSSYLRHYSFYWPIRFQLGKLKRKLMGI
ncbi:MAG: hypothetical protein MK193_07735 [Lentisphaeria bacterium]|nr:hypothetical protein [Lentisphaeria bacterium]